MKIAVIFIAILLSVDINEVQGKGKACLDRETKKGKCCVFPFIYYDGVEEKEYNDCTSDLLQTWNTNTWCSLTAYSTEDSNEWGYCKDKANTGITVGGNSDGAACVFPFQYDGKKYTKCTLDCNFCSLEKPWCATTHDYDKDSKWGYCVGKPTVPPTPVTACQRETTKGKCCLFPFTYDEGNGKGGVKYTDCTSVGLNNTRKTWCALIPNYQEENEYGYCKDKANTD